MGGAFIRDNTIHTGVKGYIILLYNRTEHYNIYFQYDSDISAYTVERTLDMEKRARMLAEMKSTSRRPTVRYLFKTIILL